MDKPISYQIRVKGHLDDAWVEWFENLTITNLEGGVAMLSGCFQDQSALQGALKRISDLGLTLISVNGVSDEEGSSSDENIFNTS